MCVKSRDKCGNSTIQDDNTEYEQYMTLTIMQLPTDIQYTTPTITQLPTDRHLGEDSEYTQ